MKLLKFWLKWKKVCINRFFEKKRCFSHKCFLFQHICFFSDKAFFKTENILLNNTSRFRLCVWWKLVFFFFLHISIYSDLFEKQFQTWCFCFLFRFWNFSIFPSIHVLLFFCLHVVDVFFLLRWIWLIPLLVTQKKSWWL